MSLSIYIIKNNEKASSSKITLYEDNIYNIGSSYDCDLILGDKSIDASHIQIHVLKNNEININVNSKEGISIDGVKYADQFIKYEINKIINIGIFKIAISESEKLIEEEKSIIYNDKKIIKKTKDAHIMLSIIASVLFYSMIFSDLIIPYYMYFENFIKKIHIFENNNQNYYIIEANKLSLPSPIPSNRMNAFKYIEGTLETWNNLYDLCYKYEIINSKINIYGMLDNKNDANGLNKLLNKYKEYIHINFWTANDMVSYLNKIAKFINLKNIKIYHSKCFDFKVIGTIDNNNIKALNIFLDSIYNDISFIKLINNTKINSDQHMKMPSRLKYKIKIITNGIMPYIMINDNERYMIGGRLNNGLILEEIYNSYVIFSYDGFKYKQDINDY